MPFALTQLSGFAAPGSAAQKSPDELSGLEFWVKSTDGITKDGSDLVSNWADQSGNGRDLAQATGSRQPLWVDSDLNGRPTIQFDGVDDSMATADFAVSQGFALFIIMRQNTWTDSDRIINIDNDSNAPSISQITSTPQIGQAGANNIVSPTLGTWYLLTSIWDGASSSQQLNDDAISSGDDPGAGAIDGLIFAKRETEARHGDVDFAEVAIYSTVPTGTDLTQLKNYFKSRYNLW